MQIGGKTSKSCVAYSKTLRKKNVQQQNLSVKPNQSGLRENAALKILIRKKTGLDLCVLNLFMRQELLIPWSIVNDIINDFFDCLCDWIPTSMVTCGFYEIIYQHLTTVFKDLYVFAKTVFFYE